MKISLCSFALPILLVVAAQETAFATQYHFSSSACQPETNADASNLWTNGSGITNTVNQTTPGYWPSVKVICPVTGMESTTQTQTELKVRYRSSAGFTSYWQVNNQNLGTIWWSTVKHPCASSPLTGCTSASSYSPQSLTVTWTGSELYGSNFTSFSTYALKADVPPKCTPTTCDGTVLQYIQAYWVTHSES